MNVYRWVLVVVALLFASISIGIPSIHAQTTSQVRASSLPNPDNDPNATNEMTTRAMRVEWRQLFNQEDWTKLEADVAQLRSQHLRLDGGIWALRLFYLTISPPGAQTSTDAAWDAQIAKLQQWAQQKPQSATPRIALADAYLEYAWKARGNGFRNAVTSEGWKLFKERATTAQTTLEQARPYLNGDPEWYFAMIRAGVALGSSRAQVDDLVNECLQIEPGYFYVPRAEANYLLPIWTGKPGDTEQFTADVANRIGGKLGDSTYFLIDLGLNCCEATRALRMSWPRVRQGFLALDELYGTNNYQRNAFAYLALKAGDQPTAQQTFSVIGDDWDRSVWKTKPIFDASRTGKRVGSFLPVQPDHLPSAEGQ